MYRLQEEGDEIDLTAAAAAANREAALAVPSRPPIDFEKYPGQRAVIKNTKYWLRGRFKTKATKIVPSAYQEVFKLYTETQAIQAKMDQTKSKVQRNILQRQLLVKKHLFSGGITRLLQDGRFLYQQYDCLAADSRCSGVFLHDAVKELTAAMCYGKSMGCGDAARHPVYFDPPPAPLLAFSSAVVHHVLSCYKTGEFISKNLDVDVESVYFEMLGLLEEYEKTDPKAFEQGMAELSQFCFARFNIRRPRRQFKLQITGSTRDGGNAQDKSSTVPATEPPGNGDGTYMRLSHQFTLTHWDEDLAQEDLERVLNLPLSKLDAFGFKERAASSDDELEYLPLTEKGRQRIDKWIGATAGDLGREFAREQNDRLDSIGMEHLPLVDYRDETQEADDNPKGKSSSSTNNQVPVEEDFTSVSQRESNSILSEDEAAARPSSLSRIMKNYKAHGHVHSNQPDAILVNSKDKESRSSPRVERAYTGLEKFYNALKIANVNMAAIPRRKDGEVTKKRQAASSPAPAANKKSRNSKVQSTRSARKSTVSQRQDVTSSGLTMTTGRSSRKPMSHSAPTPDARDRPFLMLPRTKAAYQLQAYSRPLRASLQMSKGFVHIFLGYFNAYPTRALLKNFVIKAAVATNELLRKNIGGTENQDADERRKNQEEDEASTSQTSAEDGSSAGTGEATDTTPAEMDFDRYPHTFWLLSDSVWWIRTVMKAQAKKLVPVYWADVLLGSEDVVKKRVELLLRRGNFCQELFNPIDSTSKPQHAFRNPILVWLAVLVYWAPSGGSSEAFKHRDLFSEASPFLIAFCATTIHHVLEHYTSGVFRNVRMSATIERSNYHKYLGHLARYQRDKPAGYEKLLVDFSAACRDPQTLVQARAACTGRVITKHADDEEDLMLFSSQEE
ncbi:hypothetical protein CALVIDRAFT_567186 [Calocera viscosa TUFC12733]|uniref:DUF6532 domain-containing protein n=1 Tax=Calocera viscosa (strain TUFC12733) TaxID=1330018 RepID=A0A167IJA2_CALVF|nr:hypothetical protein CALVIDRAFT_567186 [Calocera viscosa TUFC12733]